MARDILWLEALHKEDVRLAGAKGANLAEMMRASLPVPPGFVVTTRAFANALEHNGLGPYFEQRLRGLRDADGADLVALGRELKEKTLALELPPSLIDAVEQAYATFGANRPVAVRASAPFQQPFPAIHESFTDVIGPPSVLDRLRAAWASAFSARALAYRKSQGLDGGVAIAAVVQKMVNAKRSGVMFTSDPSCVHARCVVVEAAFGLGAPVVGGLVEPDTYLVFKAGPRLAEVRVGFQHYKVLRTPDGCEHHVELPDLEACTRVLADTEVLELARLGIRAESLFGHPLDVEWAEDDGGRWYLLQARALPLAQVRARGQGALLAGLPASAGVARGVVRVLRSEAELERVMPGDVLVARMVTPSWVPALRRAGAVVLDAGGLSAWAANTCRELQLPCVVATREGSRVLREGETVSVDGRLGWVFGGVEGLERRGTGALIDPRVHA